MAEFEHRPHGWQTARRFVVARRFIQQQETETTLFSMGRYIYRAWVTNLPLTPAGIWHFYDGRAGMEPRICELREDFALHKIPTASFAANALYLEIVRLAYNLVTAFQRNCLDEPWQNLTLQKLRYKLFLIPGELVRPQNRPILRRGPSTMTESFAETILARVAKVKAPPGLNPHLHAGSRCNPGTPQTPIFSTCPTLTSSPCLLRAVRPRCRCNAPSRSGRCGLSSSGSEKLKPLPSRMTPE
jgi:hypothetical protein